MCLHSFPRAAVTNHHKACGLKQTLFFLSQFWRPDVPSQGVGRAVLPLQALKENPSLPLSASGGSRCPLACGHLIPISVASSHDLPLCVSLCVHLSFLSLRRTPVIGFRMHSKSRMISSGDPSWITSVKTFY